MLREDRKSTKEQVFELSTRDARHDVAFHEVHVIPKITDRLAEHGAGVRCVDKRRIQRRRGELREALGGAPGSQAHYLQGVFAPSYCIDNSLHRESCCCSGVVRPVLFQEHKMRRVSRRSFGDGKLCDLFKLFGRHAGQSTSGRTALIHPGWPSGGF